MGTLVQAKGVEPLILAAEASKTPMYANSNTPGYCRTLLGPAPSPELIFTRSYIRLEPRCYYL